jgi:hypothetical protein
VTITIEAIFFKIRNLLLEWSGQLIFLGSNLEQAAQRLFKTEPIDQQFIRPQRGVDADLSLRSKLFSSNLLFELLRMPAAKQLLLEIVFSGP